jgi:protein TonB
MDYAIAVSLVVHIVVIAFVGFDTIKQTIKDNLPTLEVVLVNAKTKDAPTNADKLAQTNLDRGGNTDDKRSAKSPLPPEKTDAEQQNGKTTQAKIQTQKTPTEAPDKKKRDDKDKESKEVLTQADSTRKVDNTPDKKATPVAPDTSDLAARSLEAARLEAVISKSTEEYNSKPKRKAVGARTKEYRFATYIEAWRQKVERIGTMSYPVFAKGKQYDMVMTVSIRADGSIEKIVVNRSSGSAELDEAAQRIVRQGEPYAAFPDDITKDYAILDITRTWTFTQEDKLSSE